MKLGTPEKPITVDITDAAYYLGCIRELDEIREKSWLESCYHLQPLFDEKTKVINKAYKILKQHQDEFDAIAVSGMSMALIAPVLAWRLKKNIVLIRKPGEKAHSGYTFEGYTNQRVVMVDDLIDTGETFRRVKKRIEANGCSLVGVYLYKTMTRRNLGVPIWT